MDATKNERRIAKNGKAYTYKEFAAYYNSQILFAMWQEAAVLNSAEQPANTDGSTIQEYELPFSQDDELAGAAQPVDTFARRPENSVEQPVSTVCLSWDELAAMPRAEQSGGEAANAEQKRLRQHCSRAVVALREAAQKLLSMFDLKYSRLCSTALHEMARIYSPRHKLEVDVAAAPILAHICRG